MIIFIDGVMLLLIFKLLDTLTGIFYSNQFLLLYYIIFTSFIENHILNFCTVGNNFILDTFHPL